jgi:hypothetical protein
LNQLCAQSSVFNQNNRRVVLLLLRYGSFLESQPCNVGKANNGQTEMIYRPFSAC